MLGIALVLTYPPLTENPDNRAIAHDPESYHDPFIFSPERWLDGNGRLVDKECDDVFGYGRRFARSIISDLNFGSLPGKRACVGIHLAKNTIWLAIVSLLATMEFSKSKYELGNEIDISLDCATGLVAYVPDPHSYEYYFNPL